MKQILALHIVLLIGLSHALAQKTDTVTLYNGDKITCEIINLAKGKLNVKTSDMGRLSVKWTRISSIETLHRFEIILADHSTYFGKFNKGLPGAAIVSFGVFNEMISLKEITSLTQIDANFWKQLEGHLDAGGSYTKGIDNLQFNSSAEIKYRSKKYLNKLEFTSVITDNAVNISKKQTGGYTFQMFHKNSKFSVFNASWEQNTELGIDNRASINIRYGFSPVENSINLLDISAGILLNREFSSEQESSNNTEGIIDITYDFFIFTKPNIDLTTSLVVYPNFTVKQRIRAEYDFRVRWEVFNNFTLNFKYYFTYDSKPPTVDALTFDYGINTSVGYTF